MRRIVPGNPNVPDQSGFWKQALEWHSSATPRVLPNVLVFTGLATAITLLHEAAPWATIAVGPIEAGGAVLGLLLVYRVNAGYDRWWEARKLWGGIVNQSRNLVISALSYGPRDRAWREEFARWTAAFCHSARITLRGESTDSTQIRRLLGAEAGDLAANAAHLPSLIALRLAALLREARAAHGMDGFAFLQVDKERAQLIDHVGACERILRTPMPRVSAVIVRRFILLFLLLLPFALVGKMGWFTPATVAFVSYPLLSLDLIGAELQNPYSRRALSHLPLNEICAVIERNVFGALDLSETLAQGIPLTSSARPEAGAAARSAD